MLARRLAVVARGAACTVRDEPVERLVHPALDHLDVGDAGLGRGIGGPVGGVLARLLRVDGLDAALQLDQGQPAAWRGCRRALALRIRLNALAAASRSPRCSASSASTRTGSLRRLLRLAVRGDSSTAPSGIKPCSRSASNSWSSIWRTCGSGAAPLRHGHHLAGDDGGDERDALDAHAAELLRRARGLASTSTLASTQRPADSFASFSRIGPELLARLAPVGPEVHEHRDACATGR